MADLTLKGKTILVGVTGSIAAYKVCGLVSHLQQAGAEVWVTMTQNAAKLVTPLTFRTLSKNPVILDLFSAGFFNPDQTNFAMDNSLSQQVVPHISITEKADLFVVAPASANIIGKLAQGLADDPLTTMALACHCPKICCPAMNWRMWENPGVKENSMKLANLGWTILGPARGHLACDDTNAETDNPKFGRMVEIDDILSEINAIFSNAKFIKDINNKKDLLGKKILVTAGPTYEDLDPVRFIGNQSSGKMGFALAEAARRRGAEVVLIAGPTALATPPGVLRRDVRSADNMHKALVAEFSKADMLIMAAAVADFAPAQRFSQKIKKGKNNFRLIRLENTPDLLKSLRKAKGNKKIIGFAAETENLLANAKKKLTEKGLDYIVANDVARTDIGFGSDYNQVKIISAKGTSVDVPRLPKIELANRILDYVC